MEKATFIVEKLGILSYGLVTPVTGNGSLFVLNCAL